MSFKEDYDAAMKTLQRLSDAFDRMHGVLHDDSRNAAAMPGHLQRWKEKYGQSVYD